MFGRAGGHKASTCLCTNCCVRGNLITAFGDATEPEPEPAVCVASRSSGARGAGTPRYTEACLKIRRKSGSIADAALPLIDAPTVISSEFFALNGAHVILDDLGLAFAAARAWGFNDFQYASHQRKSGALDPLGGPAQAGDTTAPLMVQRQRQLFRALYPSGVPTTAAGFCARVIIAGTAIFNPRGAMGAEGSGRADPAQWSAFSAYLLRRLRLPPTRPRPPPGQERGGLVIAKKDPALRRAILNADELASAACVRQLFAPVTLAAWESMSHLEAARLLQRSEMLLTPTGASAFMALYMPTPSAVVYVPGDDRNDELYLDALSHLLVRRYDSNAAEKVGECTPGAEGQHAGCEQRHRIDAERLCARLRTTWRDFAAMRGAGVWAQGEG